MVTNRAASACAEAALLNSDGVFIVNSYEKKPVLEVKGVSKKFGAIQALKDVDFEVFYGEVVGLVGDNGAGKSTLIKVISGVHNPDSGQIFYQGKRVTITSPRVSTDLGIATVYQDLALCDNLDVVANLFVGREISKKTFPGLKNLYWLDETAMEKRALDLLERLNVPIPSVRRVVATMSGGQRQSVAVTRAVMENCSLVMLDEPTAALGVEQTERVMKLIQKLKSGNDMGVIVISHNMQDIFEITDRIIVLRLGKRVATFETKSARPDQVVAAITGAK
mgnify:CR=1 FL=1